MAQDRPRMTTRWPTWHEMAPREPRDDQRWPQDGHKTTSGTHQKLAGFSARAGGKSAADWWLTAMQELCCTNRTCSFSLGVQSHMVVHPLLQIVHSPHRFGYSIVCLLGPRRRPRGCRPLPASQFPFSGRLPIQTLPGLSIQEAQMRSTDGA